MLAELPAIIVDTREPDPAPWGFSEHPVVRRGLKTGDYSLEGRTDSPGGITIERKAPADLTACMTWSRERFERELERLAAYRVAFVIVEATLPDLLLPERWGRSHPSSRLGTVLAWMMRYPSVHWIFAGSRDAAARIALRVLERYVLEAQDAAGVQAGA